MAPGTSRNTETIAFSLHPEQARRLREEERETRARERMQRRYRQSSTDETEQGRTNGKG